MTEIKLSIANCDLWEAEASALFIHHLADNAFSYETALDKRFDGRLFAAYREGGQQDHLIVTTESAVPCPRLCTVNFTYNDLPFGYSTIDRYARQIIRIIDEEAELSNCRRVATRVFGRTGLDASESLETMVTAFASELRRRGNSTELEEIRFVEHDSDIARRLQQRLEHLLRDGTILQPARQVFQLNLSKSDTIIAREEARVEGLSHPPVFVAMPYAKEFDNVYYFGIKGPVESYKRTCERVDQHHFTGDIVRRIKERITDCEIVIGDLTGQNANVFYEVGYAEGLGKPVILLSQDEDTPFDLRTQKQIRYDPQDILNLASVLNDSLEALLSGS